MLAFSLLHPRRGLLILQTDQQVKEDSYHKYNYVSTHDKFENAVSSFFPDSSAKLESLKNEADQLQSQLREFFKKLENEPFPSKRKPYPMEYSLSNFSGIFMYLLCRLLKPEKVLETGIAYGNSSSFILQALNENKKGQLYSMDYVFRPWESREVIGSAIPSELRDRWHLIFGPTDKKLKKTLEDLGEIDIFFHDSLHTYRNMMFEFNTTWKYIKKGGFLLADDISYNSAFYEFCSSLKLKPTIIGENKELFLGVLQKPS